jgi:four helix bundle protein
MGEERKDRTGPWFAVERLDVFWAAVDVARLCDALGSRLWRRNAALWRQLQRAVASMIANIGEGASCSTMGNQRRFFEYAYRSAGECAALVITFGSLGALRADERQELLALLDRIQAMLLRMMQRAARAAQRNR